jgi:hypothetical protein
VPQPDSASAAVVFVRIYFYLHHDAQIIARIYVRLILAQAFHRRSNPGLASKKHQPTGISRASLTDGYRNMRAIHRLQLYVHIGKRYQTTERRHRKIRALFSLWTTCEFDEVRSVAARIILAFREPTMIAEHLFQQHVCEFFHYIYTWFEGDVGPEQVRSDLGDRPHDVAVGAGTGQSEGSQT